MKFTILATLVAAVSAQSSIIANSAAVPAGCGPADRSLLQFVGTTDVYQAFCSAQPGGYAAIPGAIYPATNVADCVYWCNTYNADPTNTQYDCVAALFTKFDQKCSLAWQANNNVNTRSDADYLVAVSA